MTEGRCENCKHWEYIDQNADDYEYKHEWEHVGYCAARRRPVVVAQGKIEELAPITHAKYPCFEFEEKAT